MNPNHWLRAIFLIYKHTLASPECILKKYREKKIKKTLYQLSINNKKNVSRWGIFSKKKNINKNNFYIDDVIEKPDAKFAPSNNAVIGRYILPKKIFNTLKNQKKGKGGEIHITDSIRQLIKDGEKFIGHSFKGKYLDCGTMNGYIKSSMEISKLWNYVW